MRHNIRVVAVSFIVATAPLSAAHAGPTSTSGAPAASAGARYCLRIAPATGSLAETVRCWTRAAWAEQGVAVDKEWAKEGVAVRQ